MVLPWYLSSTDYTTLFNFEGGGSKSKQFFLVGKDTNRRIQSHSVENIGGTDSCTGIRVWHTVTMNGAGNLAHITIVVYRLTDKELSIVKCPCGIRVMEVEGLVYGKNQDVRNTNIGYVVFWEHRPFLLLKRLMNKTMLFSIRKQF